MRFNTISPAWPFNELFNFAESGLPAYSREWAPMFYTSYEDTGIRITADLPGVKATDLDVSLEGDVLTIKGSRSDTGTTRTFSKSYTIKDTLDTSAMKASLENGVLNVFMPKAAKAQPKKIPVTTTVPALDA